VFELSGFIVQVVGVIFTVLLVGLQGVRIVECKVGNELDCLEYPAISCRKHSAFLSDFGGVGDGKTSNTKAFQYAISNLSHYASDGGALLVVPPGTWLTGSFNLTSHFTLFLHKEATILASQVFYSFYPLLFLNQKFFFVFLFFSYQNI